MYWNVCNFKQSALTRETNSTVRNVQWILQHPFSNIAQSNQSYVYQSCEYCKQVQEVSTAKPAFQRYTFPHKWYHVVIQVPVICMKKCTQQQPVREEKLMLNMLNIIQTANILW